MNKEKSVLFNSIPQKYWLVILLTPTKPNIMLALKEDKAKRVNVYTWHHKNQ
jgi:hypothetical protein